MTKTLKWEGRAFPHQIEGAEFLAQHGKVILGDTVRGRGILGDTVGLGKTLTSVVWLDKVGAKRTLIVGPKEITSNLRNEIPKWTNRSIFDLRGYAKDQRETVFSLLEDFDEFALIINIEAWRKDQSFLTRFIGMQLDSVIIDEAHYLNNERTLNYKGIREVVFAVNTCPKDGCGALLRPIYTCMRANCRQREERFPYRYCLACGHVATRVVLPPCPKCGTPDAARRISDARSVKHVLLMTGTPILNKPVDVFPLLHLTDPDRFTTQRAFIKAYCERAVDDTGNSRYVWKEGARDRLSQQIRPYYIARNRKDAGIVLPPQTVEVREYDFDIENYPEQWEAYTKIENEFRIELESSETLGITEVITQLLRLRQMLIWPKGIKLREPKTKNVIGQVDIGKSFKLDIVEKLVREYAESGERVVVFSHFRDPLRELQRRFGDMACVYDGGTARSMREEIKHDFGPASTQDGYKPRWLVACCNYRTAGEGLNLVGATQIVPSDEDWNPGKNGQAFGRTDRIGQRYANGVHIPRINGTIDMWMAELNDFKKGLVEGWEQSVNINKILLEAMNKR